MTDKPELSWYPTTIDELQRLLDSGVWPRVRAIADDVGPLQIAQGRLTYIDTPKLGGMSGILREGSAPAGAEPFDLTARSLWLWRAEATEPAKPTLANTAISRAAASRVKLNLNDRAHFVLTDFGAAQWTKWDLERYGRPADARAAGPHTCELWRLAQVLGADMYIGALRVIEDNAVEVEVQPSDVGKVSLGKMERERDAEAEVERLADYLLRHHASECTGPGSGVSAVDVVIRLLKRAGDFESRRLDLARCSDALRRIAAASNLMVLGMRGPEFAMELAERVEKQLALRGPVLRTDDEQIDRAALDRLTAYMRINHAHSLSLGEHVADVAIWALEKYAKDHRLLCEQLGLLPVTSSSGVRAAIKGMRKDIDDASERLAKWCPECDPGKTSLRGVIVLLEVDVLKPNAEAREALERIAVASGTGECTASALAERVEQQFADFRKVADRLSIDREIAGAAEQLVRRLVDRLVETDPEYIEQLRRGGS